jgi:hypothetical protein
MFTALMGSPTFAQSGPPIPQGSWSLHSVDSEETSAGDYAANAFDGNPATKWATEWVASAPPPPHELQINLGGVYDINGFSYLPRQDGEPHGGIRAFQFYVSMDGASWGSAVASGTFPTTQDEQQRSFATKRGQFVRLRATSEVNGRPWTTVAELNVLGTSVEPAVPSEPAIPRSSWSLHFVDSQETTAGDHATNAFDGNPATKWATEWVASAPPPPHELQINLGAVYDVSGFRYLPRQDGQVNGGIGQYQFYVSMDGSTWESAVDSGTFPGTQAEKQRSFAAKRGQFIRLRATSEVNGRAWTTVAELNVLGTLVGPGVPTGPAIPKSSWTLHFVDSQETAAGDHATNAFDGNPATKWATEWQAAAPPPPHELQINLGAVYDIDGFRYLPRQDGNANGGIRQFQFYVSMDGATWGPAVDSGTFPNTAAQQERSFAPKRGQFVRLRATSEVNGRPWTAVAELDVLSGGPPPTGGNQPPQVSLAPTGTGPYVAPASIALRATANDSDGTVTNVDFFAGSTHVAFDTTTPYDAVVPNLGVGTYAFTAVASDNSGNTAVSNTVTLTVGSGPQLPRRVVFTPSADHDTLVVHYVLRIYPAGSNQTVVATLDLGKPAVINGECDVDISALIAALSPGTYFGTVTAVGGGGTGTSAPSPFFNR